MIQKKKIRRPNSTLLNVEPQKVQTDFELLSVSASQKFPHWAVPFLKALRDSVHLYQACKITHVQRHVALWERENSPAFAAAWDIALREGVEKMETVLKNMAPKNVAALIFWLKAHDKKYRENIHFEIVARVVERFVLDVGVRLKAVIPENCPHCSGVLALGPKISDTIRELSTALEKGDV
jgi:hypothetical protein